MTFPDLFGSFVQGFSRSFDSVGSVRWRVKAGFSVDTGPRTVRLSLTPPDGSLSLGPAAQKRCA